MAQEIPGTHFVGEVAQKVLILKDGKVLMCFDKKNYQTKTRSWDLPGGRLHKGEQPIEGLEREIFEELGVSITVKRPVFVSLTEKPLIGGPPRFFVVYEALLTDPGREFTLAEDEIEEVRWIGPDDMESTEMWGAWKELLKEYFDRN